MTAEHLPRVVSSVACCRAASMMCVLFCLGSPFPAREPPVVGLSITLAFLLLIFAAYMVSGSLKWRHSPSRIYSRKLVMRLHADRSQSTSSPGSSREDRGTSRPGTIPANSYMALRVLKSSRSTSRIYSSNSIL